MGGGRKNANGTGIWLLGCTHFRCFVTVWLRDEQLTQIERAFPQRLGTSGFERKVSNYLAFKAVLNGARTGCPWRDPPQPTATITRSTCAGSGGYPWEIFGFLLPLEFEVFRPRGSETSFHVRKLHLREQSRVVQFAGQS